MTRPEFVHFFRALSTIVFVVGTACSSPRVSGVASRVGLSLDAADTIRVGISHGQEIETMFGRPTIKLPADKQDQDGDAWLYCDHEKCSEGRLTVHVAPRTDTVISVTWALKDGEPEQSLGAAHARYPGSALKRERYLYNYGHYFYTVESYVDSNQGLIFGYDPVKKVVTAISRNVPPLRDPQLAQSANGFPKISRIVERDTAAGH